MTTSAIDALGPLFVRIDHVGFAVRDLDASKDFYARAFGLATVHEETNEGQGVREAMVAVGDGAIDVAGVLAASPAARWHIVELDRCDTDMFDAVERSYHYLVDNQLSLGRT